MKDMLPPNPSFKLTEIGWIPEDWEVIKIGEHATFLNNGSLSKAEYTQNGTIYYIHYGDIHTSEKIILDIKNSELPTVPSNKVQSLSRLKDGDLIFVDASEDLEGIGKSIEIINVDNLEVVAGLHTIALRFDERQLVNGFKAYLQYIPHLRKQLRTFATGIKVYAIQKKHIANLKLPLPPLSEQHAIATVLSDVDKLIESLDELINKKQAIKKATMHLLLTGKKRLPGFTGEWVKRKLREIANIKKGVQLNRDLLNSNDLYPVWNGGTEPSGYHHSYNATENSITISEGGNSCGFVNYITTKFWLGGHCYLIQPNIELNKIFLYYLLKYNEHKIMALRVGSGLPNIQVNRLEAFNIFYPIKNDEQQAIAQVLSDMDSEIEALQAKRDKLKQLKQGMMQVLLTGKIRLVETSKEAEV